MLNLVKEEFTPKVDNANIPPDLGRALADLIHEIALLWPDLSPVQQRRIRYRLDRVITEAAEPSTETHWWEVYLDLSARIAQEHGAAGGQPQGVLPEAGVRTHRRGGG